MQEVIIDSDFYTNATQMRDVFINLDFAKNENMLQGQICTMQFANVDMLRHMQNLIAVPKDIEAFDFVDGSGSFIINQENELPSRSICVQFPDLANQWVGLVSLNHSEEPNYLKFYKHLRTGWD